MVIMSSVCLPMDLSRLKRKFNSPSVTCVVLFPKKIDGGALRLFLCLAIILSCVGFGTFLSDLLVALPLPL